MSSGRHRWKGPVGLLASALLLASYTGVVAASSGLAAAQDTVTAVPALQDTDATQRWFAQQGFGIIASSTAPESSQIPVTDGWVMPTAGRVGSPWGLRLHPILGYVRLHNGQDIGGVCGQDVYAAESGKVTRSAYGYNGGSGNNVRISHGMIGGVAVESSYLHLSNFIVSAGQRVTKGQLIGYVGSTGLSTACHLHFAVYENGVGVDPAKYLHNATPITLTAAQIAAAAGNAVVAGDQTKPADAPLVNEETDPEVPADLAALEGATASPTPSATPTAAGSATTAPTPTPTATSSAPATSPSPTSTPRPTNTAPTNTPPTSTAPTNTPPTSTAPTSTAPTSTAPTSTAPTSTAPASTASARSAATSSPSAEKSASSEETATH